ncbi:hypothetical protein HK097_011331 [Rhizophlyctis rosea]|uniref:Uncharacterized protein n=1 Tax=Rhizophlyctis rosea TaxID=64517 RepID=A0AAD5S8Y2_9FUNG|nr:hypothetical protein HK097_011331 [Rhizophlyctis rosea]
MQNIFKSGTDSPRLKPVRTGRVPLLNENDEDGEFRTEIKGMLKSIVGMLKKEKEADGSLPHPGMPAIPPRKTDSSLLLLRPAMLSEEEVEKIAPAVHQRSESCPQFGAAAKNETPAGPKSCLKKPKSGNLRAEAGFGPGVTLSLPRPAVGIAGGAIYLDLGVEGEQLGRRKGLS